MLIYIPSSVTNELLKKSSRDVQKPFIAVDGLFVASVSACSDCLGRLEGVYFSIQVCI
jgi:hypothetical protein